LIIVSDFRGGTCG